MKITPIAVAVAAAMFSLSAVAGGDKQQSQSGAQGSSISQEHKAGSASGATSAQNEGKTAQSPELVKQAQTKLNVTADGKMGPQTQKAVKEFQTSKGLDASGQLDQKTIAALGVSGGDSASAGGSAATTSDAKTEGTSASGGATSAQPKSETPAKQQ